VLKPVHGRPPCSGGYGPGVATATRAHIPNMPPIRVDTRMGFVPELGPNWGSDVLVVREWRSKATLPTRA